jgi:hypothetical protein
MENIDPQILLISEIHEFQQVTLPGWVFDPGSSFCFEVICGEYEAFSTGAREAGGKNFATAISVKDVANPKGHLLEFGPPEETTLCLFIFISVDPCVRIFMAEHSSRGHLMFCEKREDGTHCNQGPFKNKTAKAFLEKIRKVLSAEN